MKAMVLREQGSYDGLDYGDVPDPTPARGEALVRVRACSLNRADLFAVQGIKGVRPRLPLILGRDIAGEIVEPGEESAAAGLAAGDRVLIAPQLHCGACEFCQTGREQMCERAPTIGVSRDGGLAELVAAPGRALFALPDSLGFEAAAAVPTAYLTAYHMLVGSARVQPGETVLVFAAGSGVGAAAVQIARHIGARVIATAGSAPKLAKALELGAEAAFNHSEGSVAEQVNEATGGRGVDVVIDHVGTAVWGDGFGALRRGGRLVNCGVTSGHRVDLHLGQLFVKNISVMGSTMGTRAEMRQLLALLGSGDIVPQVDAVYPLAQATEAFKRMESSEFFGKIVVTP